MNFIFISPHFPRNFWHFCDRLHKDGVNVLGIGDMPSAEMEPELEEVLSEYYQVDSMTDYDQVYRAVAYFAFKYGKPDWIESNNEYWLEQDARLRTDFNIRTGVQSDEVVHFRSKSEMKTYYAKAGVPTAKQIVVTDLAAAEKFIEEVGYPVIVKPDVGLGAKHTWKLENKKMLVRFFSELPKERYVMEEFVEGNIYTYDAVIDSHGEPLFEACSVMPPSMADIVNEQRELSYYVPAQMPERLRELGRATCEGFGVKSRFVHLEFFCMTEDKEGLGKTGDFVGLEVNMRPSGSFTLDMINFAHSTDVYQIWADMITLDMNVLDSPKGDQFCVYASRRDRYSYVHGEDEILSKYGKQVVMHREVAPVMVSTMGNRMYAACFAEKKDMDEFVNFVQKKN